MTYRILELFIKTLLSIALASPAVLVRAQTTNATCSASWAWTSNSKQQSPCLVAAYLLAPCANGQWNVPALQSGQYYTPPTIAVANQCSCSTVIYQLMSACGSCQGQEIVAWSSWKGNCADSVTSVATYPRAIPDATAVPAWAYIDITPQDRFNATVALALAGQAESSAPGGSTSVAPSTSSSPASITTSPSTSSSSSSSSPTSTDGGGATESSSNIGPIVGGTVGGVVGLGLIVCLAIFLMRRQSGKSKHLAPSAEFSKVMPPGSPVPHNFDPAAVGFRSRTASPLSNGLNSDYSHGAPNIHQIGMGGHTNGVGAPYGGSPWSPPPTGHTPAPSSGAYSSVYTPPPPGPGTGQHYTYTPPPGAMGSTPSMGQYSHSHSNSGVTGYNPTPVSYQNMSPYGAHGRNNSYTQASSGAPEM